MKKLSSFVLAVLLFVSTLVLITPNAIARTTGNYVTNEQRSGQFSVPANLEAGVDFTNQIKQEVSVTFSTEGTWIVGNKIPEQNANGFDSSYLGEDAQYLKYPNYNAFSLLAVNKNSNPPTVNQVGKQRTITLTPGATLKFLINETIQADTYNDNTGSIIVKWSVISTNKPDIESVPAPVSQSDLMINFFAGKTFEISAANGAGYTTSPYNTPPSTRQISFRKGQSPGFTHLSFNSGCGFYEIDLVSEKPEITSGKSLRWPITFNNNFALFSQGAGGPACTPIIYQFNHLVLESLRRTYYGWLTSEIMYNVGDNFLTLRSITSPHHVVITMNVPPDVKASLANLINQ